MFNLKLKLFHKNQRGFSLLELMVSLAIASIISLGALIANAQVLSQTSRNNDYTTASRQALNAVHWISRDAQMSHNVTGADTFPGDDLTLTWTEWDNSQHVAIYSLEDNKLSRSYTEVVGGVPGPTQVTTIAEYINDDPAYTNSCYTDSVLTIKITSSVGENDLVVDFTKQASITSRPNI